MKIGLVRWTVLHGDGARQRGRHGAVVESVIEGRESRDEDVMWVRVMERWQRWRAVACRAATGCSAGGGEMEVGGCLLTSCPGRGDGDLAERRQRDQDGGDDVTMEAQAPKVRAS